MVINDSNRALTTNTDKLPEIIGLKSTRVRQSNIGEIRPNTSNTSSKYVDGKLNYSMSYLSTFNGLICDITTISLYASNKTVFNQFSSNYAFFYILH